MNKVIIIGGGAAGLFAAICIKKELKEQIEVTILERQNRVGKKLLSTGNGKCNLSNIYLNLDCYNTEYINNAINEFDANKCIHYFYELGLMLRIDESGRIYPYGEKANMVVDLLMRHVERLGIKVITGFNVSHIKKPNQFIVYSTDYRLLISDYVIVATGGMSSIPFKNETYKLLTYFGHTMTPLSPALVALKTLEDTKTIAGIRIKGQAKIEVDNVVLASEVGEILFKNEGLSGICIFELSRHYKPNAKIKIDLAYDKSESEIEKFLNHSSNVQEALLGMFPKMIVNDLLQRKGNVIKNIKNYEFTVIDTYGYDTAQITKGGISIKEFIPDSYESIYVKGLYAVGELLDVDGKTGGYNLHFAWSSAYLASKQIIEMEKKLWKKQKWICQIN